MRRRISATWPRRVSRVGLFVGRSPFARQKPTSAERGVRGDQAVQRLRAFPSGVSEQAAANCAPRRTTRGPRGGKGAPGARRVAGHQPIQPEDGMLDPGRRPRPPVAPAPLSPSLLVPGLTPHLHLTVVESVTGLVLVILRLFRRARSRRDLRRVTCSTSSQEGDGSGSDTSRPTVRSPCHAACSRSAGAPVVFFRDGLRCRPPPWTGGTRGWPPPRRGAGRGYGRRRTGRRGDRRWRPSRPATSARRTDTIRRPAIAAFAGATPPPDPGERSSSSSVERGHAGEDGGCRQIGVVEDDLGPAQPQLHPGGKACPVAAEVAAAASICARCLNVAAARLSCRLHKTGPNCRAMSKVAWSNRAAPLKTAPPNSRPPPGRSPCRSRA